MEHGRSEGGSIVRRVLVFFQFPLLFYLLKLFDELESLNFVNESDIKKTPIFVLLIVVVMTSSSLASLVSIHQEVYAFAYVEDNDYIEDTSESFLYQNFSDSAHAVYGGGNADSSMSTQLDYTSIQFAGSARAEGYDCGARAVVDVFFDLSNDADFAFALTGTRDGLYPGTAGSGFSVGLFTTPDFGHDPIWEYIWSGSLPPYDEIDVSGASEGGFLQPGSYRLFIYTGARSVSGERWIDVENFEFALVGEDVSIPEPATVCLLGLGGLLLRRRRAK